MVDLAGILLPVSISDVVGSSENVLWLINVQVVNFIQFPLPEGSETGAAGIYGQPGALGFGQQTSTALVLFNSFGLTGK